MAVRLQSVLRNLSQINRAFSNIKHVRTFHCTMSSFSRISAADNSDLMSRIRIVVDEKDSSKIVREIVSIGDPVAVDLEVNIKEKYDCSFYLQKPP